MLASPRPRSSRWLALLFLPAFAVTTASAGRLVGAVTNAEGTPLGAVEVRAVPSESELPTVTSKTKDNGKFVFGLLRQGHYRLAFFKNGMRVARIDGNTRTPEDTSSWAFHQDVPPGSTPPEFEFTGVTDVTYDVKLASWSGAPGEWGTGVPVATTGALVELIQSGKFERAMDELARNLEARPDDPTLHYLHGYALYAQAKHDEAAVALQRALELKSDFEGVNLLLGKVLEAKGSYDEARAAYDAELAIAKSDEVRRDSYIGLASLHIRAQRLEDAAAALEQVVALAPENVGAARELAEIYARLGESEKAQALLGRLDELGGTDAATLYNMGAERYNSGDMTAASDYFNKAIAADASMADAYRMLAFIQIGQGDRESAKQNLKRFLELKNDEGDPMVQSARAILQQIGD